MPPSGWRPDHEVESALITVADALLPGPSDHAGARQGTWRCTAAAQCAQVLLARAEHVPTVVAADLISAARQSVRLLREPSVMEVLQARTAWEALQQVLRRSGADRLVVSEADILDGIAWSLVDPA